MPPPVLTFFPYLPLDRSHGVGPWQIVPVASYDGAWLSTEFDNAAHLFLSHFVDIRREQVENPALVAHGVDGINGVLLEERARDALQASLDFAVLDTAPRWDETEARGTLTALRALTSDNTELFAWPVDPEDRSFAIPFGLLVTTTSGGHKLDDPDDVIPCPTEVRLPFGSAAFDEELATALYEALVDDERASRNDLVALRGRLLAALRWWARAHRNTTSITWEDRIVMLKTAFEALLDESTAWQGARRIRELFESRVDDPGDGLWWSPEEPERFRVRLAGADRSLTDLQHWFVKFAFLRNSIIHEGQRITAATECYEESGPYQGPFFHRADELFRQAVKVVLVDFGAQHLWHSQLTRNIARALKESENEPEP